ncbi:MAG: EamA family transporter [Eubacteriales bacterium]
MKTRSYKIGILLALLAATLYAINSPLSKILLNYIQPTIMAGFLYVGAGVAMLVIALIRKCRKTKGNETKLTKKRVAVYGSDDPARYNGTYSFADRIKKYYRG